MKLIIQTLNKSHERKNFECGKSLLDSYLRHQVSQDVKRDLSACFVLVDQESDSNSVIGYYTLSSNSLERNIFPSDMIAKLPPSYGDLPTILLGRLAVDSKYKGNGYGEVLLLDALNQCVDLSQRLGVLAVVVDPIDENAVKFYQNYGFILLPDSGKMFIPIKTIEETLL